MIAGVTSGSRATRPRKIISGNSVCITSVNVRAGGESGAVVATVECLGLGGDNGGEIWVGLKVLGDVVALVRHSPS